jgi:DNA mismatch endonuclease (patch repair protein)
VGWQRIIFENPKNAIKSNREFRIAKIERNRQRDLEVNAIYRSKGWKVLRFWDIELKEKLGAYLKTVLDHLQIKVYQERAES